MKKSLLIFDRLTKRIEEEKIYGGFFLKCVYSSHWFSKILGALFLPFICRIPFSSKWYGKIQKTSISRTKIKPFIEKFNVDSSEFLDPVDSFNSFNDFFIRKLKPSAREIVQDEDVLVMPADGRYLASQNIYEHSDLWVKGKRINFKELLGGDEELIKRFDWGSMLLARLAPVDYHRFHFPCDCIPGEPRLINGPLFSVNPIALKRNINYLSQNKRVITLLETEDFGTIAYIEIGATYVGSIHQTYIPGKEYKKGDEKGYFSFGGSSLILLFEHDKILFEHDLIEHTDQGFETKALMGQIMALDNHI
ncbi:MAG: archaetidylserine decarboxylase [Rhabdochlamydiaceae bacterium]|nr:archaetidylserine decarboxylase [Candidatus Amphrikana amoebophyrae]